MVVKQNAFGMIDLYSMLLGRSMILQFARMRTEVVLGKWERHTKPGQSATFTGHLRTRRDQKIRMRPRQKRQAFYRQRRLLL